MRLKLSVIIPVFNEVNTIGAVLNRVLENPLEKEIIVIDDGSTDGSPEVLKKFDNKITLLEHKLNKGKGAAILTALPHAKNEITLIQDADLELDPNDYSKLVEPFSKTGVEAVLGSRFLSNSKPPITFLFNKALSILTFILFRRYVSDIMTGYKVIRTELFQSLNLHEKNFSIEPEIIAELLKRKIPIVEVPVTYIPRNRSEGKKIRYIKDGLGVVVALCKKI